MVNIVYPCDECGVPDIECKGVGEYESKETIDGKAYRCISRVECPISSLVGIAFCVP